MTVKNNTHPKCPKCRDRMINISYLDIGNRVNIGYICKTCGTYKIYEYLDHIKLTRWNGGLFLGLKRINKPLHNQTYKARKIKSA